MSAVRFPALGSTLRAAAGGRQPAEIARAMTAAGYDTSRQSVAQWMRGANRPVPERMAVMLDVLRASDADRAAVWQAFGMRGAA